MQDTQINENNSQVGSSVKGALTLKDQFILKPHCRQPDLQFRYKTKLEEIGETIETTTLRSMNIKVKLVHLSNPSMPTNYHSKTCWCIESAVVIMKMNNKNCKF